MTDSAAIDSLPAALHQAWAALIEGASRRGSPFHQGVLASINAEGPQARYVVLRSADVEHGLLAFHTDTRAPKCTEIAADPRVSWCFFGDTLQLRCSGRAQLQTEGALVDAAWQHTTDFGRRGYHALQAPGTPLDQPGSGLPAELEQRLPNATESALIRPRFARVEVQLDRIDWLHLGHRGHWRARFERRNDWAGCWLQP